MFNAIACKAVHHSITSVTTVAIYSPDDIPATDPSYIMFMAEGHQCKVVAEIFSADSNRGRYSVTHQRPCRKPLVTDRSYLIRG